MRDGAPPADVREERRVADGAMNGSETDTAAHPADMSADAVVTDPGTCNAVTVSRCVAVAAERIHGIMGGLMGGSVPVVRRCVGRVVPAVCAPVSGVMPSVSGMVGSLVPFVGFFVMGFVEAEDLGGTDLSCLETSSQHDRYGGDREDGFCFHFKLLMFG